MTTERNRYDDPPVKRYLRDADYIVEARRDRIAQRWIAGILITALVCCLLLVSAAQAETLAVIHTGCASGDAPEKCTGGKYDTPKAADLVRERQASNAWVVRVFSAVATGALIDACDTPGVARGAAFPIPYNASADPCKNWTPVAAATFAALAPGMVRVTWALDTAGAAATSVWLYSGLKGATLGKLKQVTLPATFADVPVFTTAGTYSYGVTAANAAGESAATVADFEVKAPPTPLQPPSKPAAVSITGVSLKF